MAVAGDPGVDPRCDPAQAGGVEGPTDQAPAPAAMAQGSRHGTGSRATLTARCHPLQGGGALGGRQAEGVEVGELPGDGRRSMAHHALEEAQARRAEGAIAVVDEHWCVHARHGIGPVVIE